MGQLVAMREPGSEPGTKDIAKAGMPSAPRVRVATFDDYDQIATLQAEYERPIMSLERWKHLWVNNPAQKQLKTGLPIGWVLERQDNAGEDKKIVGYLGNIPLFCELGGQRILASVAHAWVVDVHYRAYSLMLLDYYFSQKSVELFLNATVGAAGFESFGVFGSLRVPAGEWDQSVFWITNYQGFIRGWLEKKGVPLAKPLSYVLGIAASIKEIFSNGTLRNAGAKSELQSCTEIDERFNRFWDELKERNPNVLLGFRTRETLEWHFGSALRKGEAWIVTAGKERIEAYGIFFRHDNENYDLKRLRLVDFQALDGSTTLLLPMLSWAYDKCRRSKIHMLECIGFREDKWKVIADAAPYKRQLPCWLYFYKARDKALAQKLADPNVWNPSQFDGDASL
jgi:hypothetical protein